MRSTALLFTGLVLLSARAPAAEYLIKTRSAVASKRLEAFWSSAKRVREDVILVNTNASMAERLRARPEVLLVEENAELELLAVPNDLTSSLWNFQNPEGFDVNAVAAWDMTTGSKNVVVAVIDSGIDVNHRDLQPNFWVNPAELTGQPNVDDDANGFVDDINGYGFALNSGNVHDGRGHGSHVAGIIGAVGNNGRGITGLNWNVSLMTLNTFAPQTNSKIADAIRAIDYAVLMKANIINASWGRLDPTPDGSGFQLLREAVERAARAGILFVAASGNDGVNTDRRRMVPAGFDVDNVIAVGSMDRRGRLGQSSNFGRESVDVVAPGVNILSTVPNNGTDIKSGTSMAAPHVAGVAALMLAKNPRLSYTEIKRILIATCTPNPQLWEASACGGHLDAAGAVRAAGGG